MVCTRGVPPPGSRDPRLATNRFYAYALPFVWIAPPDKQKAGIDLHVSKRLRIAPESVDPTIKNYHWIDLVLSLFDAYDRGADTSCVVDAQATSPKARASTSSWSRTASCARPSAACSKASRAGP